MSKINYLPFKIYFTFLIPNLNSSCNNNKLDFEYILLHILNAYLYLVSSTCIHVFDETEHLLIALWKNTLTLEISTSQRMTFRDQEKRLVSLLLVGISVFSCLWDVWIKLKSSVRFMIQQTYIHIHFRIVFPLEKIYHIPNTVLIPHSSFRFSRVCGMSGSFCSGKR
jgi:hypothetical protein